MVLSEWFSTMNFKNTKKRNCNKKPILLECTNVIKVYYDNVSKNNYDVIDFLLAQHVNLSVKKITLLNMLQSDDSGRIYFKMAKRCPTN